MHIAAIVCGMWAQSPILHAYAVPACWLWHLCTQLSSAGRVGDIKECDQPPPPEEGCVFRCQANFSPERTLCSSLRLAPACYDAGYNKPGQLLLTLFRF